MTALDYCRHNLDEIRHRYQTQKHRKLTRYKNETWLQYRKRKRIHKHRIKHLDKITANQRAKCAALQKAKDDRKDEPKGPVVEWEGVFVASWIVPWLERSRRAGWVGNLVSGWRDPAYSEQLCINMCGQPQCPGTCAGRSSNHSGEEYPAGAVDVSDFAAFERIQFEIGSPLRNDLPNDPVHFSVSGH